MEGRLTGDGLFRPNLSLSDTQQIFLFLLIDFDLPTIEVSLENGNDIGSRIGHQQVSGLAVEAMPMSVIGQRRDDDQAQRKALSATTPEQWADGFVSELMRATGGKDGSALPGNGVVLTHVFGSSQILAVDAAPAAARLSFRQSRQVDVFTRAADQYVERQRVHADDDGQADPALGDEAELVQPRRYVAQRDLEVRLLVVAAGLQRLLRGEGEQELRRLVQL